jgi:hypothetical protein
MIRRILVVGTLGLLVAGGARFALGELSERAWQKRKGELLELALFQPELRRPWEVRLESALNCVRSSPRFAELSTSAHKPFVALGEGEPRALSELERLWVEAAEGEFAALEPLLASLGSRCCARSRAPCARAPGSRARTRTTSRRRAPTPTRCASRARRTTAPSSAA